MNWFATLTGFKEGDHNHAVGKLVVDGDRLHSTVNGRSYAIGRLEWPTLEELRDRAQAVVPALAGKVSVSLVPGDVGDLHRDPRNAMALFQVASQFNLLEMTGPNITPEDGVTRYAGDPTQGPRCAIAAGAATVYRNYFVPVDGEIGQTRERQIDCLADVGRALGNDGGRLWQMRNGYALCSPLGLRKIAEALARLTAPGRTALRDRLRIGVQWNVEVTDRAPIPAHHVSQAFCSALPVNYCENVADIDEWQPFAELVLEGSYEATLWTAALNAVQSGSRTVYLTRVGGGAFHNPWEWIDRAMRRALDRVAGLDLDVRINCYGGPDALLVRLAADLA